MILHKLSCVCTALVLLVFMALLENATEWKRFPSHYEMIDKKV